MPAGPRVRSNNVFGTTTDNPLTAGAGTFNSAGLANLPVIAAAHATVTLDPIRQFGEPEIVVVTAHTALATVATITRGQYGTVARDHPQGTLWVHAALDEDFIEVLTSLTRPTNQYEGQFIFETDTNKLVGYGGVGWSPRDAGGNLDYAQVVADQAGISTETDLTGLTVTFDAVADRSYKYTAHLLVTQLTNPGAVTLKLTNSVNTEVQRMGHATMATNDVLIFDGTHVESGLSGSITRKLRLASSAVSVSALAAATRPAFLLVEDIGAT